MTMNGAVIPILAMYVVAAEEQVRILIICTNYYEELLKSELE